MTAIHQTRRPRTIFFAALLAIPMSMGLFTTGLSSDRAFAAESAPREALITVSGEGHAAVAPDMAILSFSVVKTEKTAREALHANSKAMSDVLAALKSAGIADRDLQTSGFSINPQYQYPDNSDGGNRQPTLIGYQVANGLTIRVRALDTLGSLIDQAVSLGINQGGSIQFTNDKPDATIDAARKAAVADAIAKAKVLTEAAGVSIGRLLEISENAGRPEPMPMLGAMAKDSQERAAPIAAGENSYSVTVTLTYAIAEK